MNDSSLTTTETVKLALQRIKNHLLEEAWFREAQKREGFDVASVDDAVVAHIQELTEQDNLYALGSAYYSARTRGAASQIRNAPLAIRLMLTFSVVSFTGLLVTSFLKSWFFPEYGIVFEIPLLMLLPVADSIESWWTRARIRTATATRAATDVEKAMRSLIERSVREVTTPHFTDPAADILTLGEGTGLSSRVDKTDRIATRYRAAVEMHLLRPGGAAVGVTGERGTGKSELLRSLLAGPTRDRAARYRSL